MSVFIAFRINFFNQRKICVPRPFDAKWGMLYKSYRPGLYRYFLTVRIMKDLIEGITFAAFSSPDISYSIFIVLEVLYGILLLCWKPIKSNTLNVTEAVIAFVLASRYGALVLLANLAENNTVDQVVFYSIAVLDILAFLVMIVASLVDCLISIKQIVSVVRIWCKKRQRHNR